MRTQDQSEGNESSFPSPRHQRNPGSVSQHDILNPAFVSFLASVGGLTAFLRDTFRQIEVGVPYHEWQLRTRVVVQADLSSIARHLDHQNMTVYLMYHKLGEAGVPTNRLLIIKFPRTCWIPYIRPRARDG